MVENIKNCCSSESLPINDEASSRLNFSSKRRCPVDGKAYHKVAYATVLHHVKEPWRLSLAEQSYYFCSNPKCDVVYFGENDFLISKKMLRLKVGVKENSDDSLICYCFDVTKAMAKSSDSAHAFVLEQTQKSNCSCVTSNPSGRCCLKDFPKIK